MYVNEIINYTSVPVTFVVKHCVTQCGKNVLYLSRVLFWRAGKLNEHLVIEMLAPVFFEARNDIMKSNIHLSGNGKKNF